MRYSKRSVLQELEKRLKQGKSVKNLDGARLTRIAANGQQTSLKRKKENEPGEEVTDGPLFISPRDIVALAFAGSGSSSVWIGKVGGEQSSL